MLKRIVLLAGAVAACCAVAGSAVAHVLGGARPVGSRAQPQLFVSPNGSDSGRCSAAKPCASFQHAYDVAQPGQVVQVAGGTYPVEKISGTKAGPKVVFRPATGASVTTGGFDVYADQLELRDFKTDYVATWAGSDSVTTRNVHMDTLFIEGSTNTSIIGGEVGPAYVPGGNTPSSFITYAPDGVTAPRNILIDGVRFHDFRRGTPDEHMECLHVAGGFGITIRDSRFTRCDVFDIFFTEWAGPDPPQDILVENNFFDEASLDGVPGNTYYSVRFSDHMEYYKDITVRYNSFVQGMSIDVSPVQGLFDVIGNLGPSGGCARQVTYAYNVWSTGKCGPTDKHAAPGFVDPGKLNLHLKRGSKAINAGDPKDFPKRDIDGQRRPMGKRPDAGADESR